MLAKKDFFIMLVTLVTVYVTTTGVGLAVGISCSVLVYLWENAFSDVNSPIVEHKSGSQMVVVTVRQDLNFLTAGRFIDAVTSTITLQIDSDNLLANATSWNEKLKLQIQAVLDHVLKPDLTRGVKVSPKAFIVDLQFVRIVDLSALENILDAAQIIRSKKSTFTIIHASPIIATSLTKLGFQNDEIDHTIDDQALYREYLSGYGNIIPFKPIVEIIEVDAPPKSTKGDNMSVQLDADKEVIPQSEMVQISSINEQV
jgi:MFS superfamily sulfate permease-like transporter